MARIVQENEIIKLTDGQNLFEIHQKTHSQAFIVLSGKMCLTRKNLKQIKILKGGTLGEEGLFEHEKVRRRDTAASEDESIVLGLDRMKFNQMEKLVEGSNLALDWFTLFN